MKIRNGFVSNSSSSNFICIGVGFDSSEIEKKNENNFIRLCGCKPSDGLYEALETLKEIKCTGGESDGLCGEDMFIGNVFTWSDEDPDGFSFDIDKLITEAQKRELKDVCSVLGIPYKIKLYAGVLHC